MSSHSFSGFSKPVQKNAVILHDSFVKNTKLVIDIEKFLEAANVGFVTRSVFTQGRDLDLLALV